MLHDRCSFIRNALLIINYVQISFRFYMFLSYRYTINVCYFIRVNLSLLYYTTSFIGRDLVQQYIEHGPWGFLILTTNYTYKLKLSKHKKQRKEHLYILWDIANFIHCLGTEVFNSVLYKCQFLSRLDDKYIVFIIFDNNLVWQSSGTLLSFNGSQLIIHIKASRWLWLVPYIRGLVLGWQNLEAETKWPPFSRRHFQTHFLEWNCMNFD